MVEEETTLSAATILPENEAATITGAVVSQGDLVGAVASQGDLLDELEGEEVDGAQNTTSDGDEDLQAQPSQIREVIVEAPEVKFSLTYSADAAQEKIYMNTNSCRFRPIKKLKIQN